MKIVVTQNDIERGTRYRACACPVALAIKRRTSRECEVAGRYMIFRSDINTKYDLPTPVRKFVVDFDTGKPVKPFSFELDLGQS